MTRTTAQTTWIVSVVEVNVASCLPLVADGYAIGAVGEFRRESAAADAITDSVTAARTNMGRNGTMPTRSGKLPSVLRNPRMHC